MSFRVKSVLLLAAAALFAASQAFAQDAAPAAAPEAAAPAEEQRGVEEIIITSTKREANIQEVPIAVSAFQGDELEARRIDEIEDLAQVSPSIHINSSNTASAGGTIRIRGVGTTGNNIGLEASVGVFIDDVYRSRSGQAFSDLLDIERIEVLRGPQGTLFGKNTSAGAVNVVTKLPVLTDSDGFAQVELGNYNHKRVATSFSAPIIDEVLGFRVAAAWSDRDGIYKDFHSGDSAGTRDRYLLRGQLLWTPTDTLDFRLIGDYSQRNESCCPAVWVRGGSTVGRVGTRALANGLGRDVPVLADRGKDVSHISTNKWHVGWNEKPFENVTDWGVSLKADWDLDFVQLTSITAYRKFSAHYAEDVDFGSADVLHPQDPNGGGAFDIFTNFSEEIRAAGTIEAINTDYLVGFYGYTEGVDTHTRIEWGKDAAFVILGSPSLTALTVGEGYERDAEIDTSGWALFTNNTWHIIDALDFTLGARYGQEYKDAHSNVNGAAAGTFINAQHCSTGFFINSFCNNLSWKNNGEDEKEWTYTFSLAYHITEDINTYVSYSKGYKAGGFNTDQDSDDCTLAPAPAPPALRPLSGTCAGVGGVEANGTHFSPEFSTSYEVGIKGVYLDGRARVNVAAFHTVFDDFQLNTFTGLGFIVSNAKGAESNGAEIEAFLAPMDGMSVTFGTTYADARYSDPSGVALFNLANPWAVPTDGLPCACDIAGHRLTNAPAWTGTASLGYEHVLPQTEWMGFTNVNTAYRGRHNTGSNLHPYKFEDAHWFVNLAAGVRSPDEHWELSVWSSNLTNTYDRSVIFDTPTQSGTFHSYVNPPRMWGGTIKYNFN